MRRSRWLSRWARLIGSGQILSVCLVVILAVGCRDTHAVDREPAAPESASRAHVGISEQEALASHASMVDALIDIAQRAPDENKYLAQGTLSRWLEVLSELPGDALPKSRWLALVSAAQAELYQGDLDAALAHLAAAQVIELAHGDAVPTVAREQSLFLIGVTHLRQGELEHCVDHHNPERCLFPIAGGGVHENVEPARHAIEAFAAILAMDPERVDARWLLNIAHMAAGDYPDGVDERHVIAPERFASDEEFPRFPDVAASAGLATVSLSGGVVVDDLNGDGYLDVMVSDWHPNGRLRLFANDRRGRFVETTRRAGLDQILGGLNLTHADYDNDGDVDIVVLRGAWLGRGGRHPNSLLRNDGAGRFTDVALAAGIAGKGLDLPTQTAAWADFDNDGWLDLFVGNETVHGQWSPCQLFMNQQDGTFEERGRSAGIANFRWTKGVVAGDLNDDGWPEIYVSNQSDENRLYRNRGDGTFVDVAVERSVTEPRASFPVCMWDMDEDGHRDLFVAGYGSDWSSSGLMPVVNAMLGKRGDAERSALYRGGGDLTFRDVASGSGLDAPSLPMGSNFGDLDGDGRLDLYLGTGEPALSGLMPNLLYRNRGGGKFADVTTAAGMGHLQKGHAVAFADLDQDGDLDVFEQMGGSAVSDVFPDALYENPGFGAHFLVLRLEGRTSNRSAIGARIRVTFEDGGSSRTVTRWVDSGGSFGANPLRQTFGIGSATRATLIEVHWPTSGTTQRFENVAADRFLEIVEDEDELRELPYETTKLGGAE